MIDLDAALVAQYRERLAELRGDRAALEWGGLRVEAALKVLGDDAPREMVDALLDAARADS